MSLATANRKTTQWLAAALVVINLTCLSTVGRAGDARIAEDAGPGHVVLEANEATLDQILELLAARFEFAVWHVAGSSSAVSVSGRIQGSLDQLLQRILRHDGYVIVRSPQSKAEISQVIVLDHKGGETLGTATVPAGNAQSARVVIGAPPFEGASPTELSKPMATSSPGLPIPQPPAEPIAQGVAPQSPTPDSAQHLMEEIGRLIRVDATRSVGAL